MKWDRLGAMACVIIVGLAIVAGLSYGLWRAVVKIEHGILAAWALAAMALIPLAAYTGYRLGGTEARGLIAGIIQGTGPVVQTAEKIANVKVSTARAMKQEPMIVELPRMIDVTPKRLPDGNDQVVM